MDHILAEQKRISGRPTCASLGKPTLWERLTSFFTIKTARAAETAVYEWPCNTTACAHHNVKRLPMPCPGTPTSLYCHGTPTQPDYREATWDPDAPYAFGLQALGTQGCEDHPPESENMSCPCEWDTCENGDPPRCPDGECDPASICVRGYSCGSDGCCHQDPRTPCDFCFQCQDGQVCSPDPRTGDNYCATPIEMCLDGVWKACSDDCPPNASWSNGCCHSNGGDGGGSGGACDPLDPWGCACLFDWECETLYGTDYGCDPKTGYCYDAYADGPILIDINGDGYSLTSATEGVTFDLRANGKPMKFSWTAPGSDDAWLALDRNGNGIIDDGSELFGNFTPQPTGQSTNGFKALVVYDLPENGGNGDGVIDGKDDIFARLLLWVDKNHNGISDPTELYRLSQLGITAIMLDYKASKWMDAYGNRFRFRTKVVRGKPGPAADHWAYDVYLVPDVSR